MGLLRLAFLGLLIFFLYRWLFPKKKLKPEPSRPSSTLSKSMVTDVLVEDPHCHTYVPKRSALPRRVDDETLYFCSDKCYEAYLLQKGAEK